MFSKRFLLVFVVVLFITSEITAKELASNHESEVKYAKYVHDVSEYYKGGLGVGGFINRRLKQSANDPPSYPLPPQVPQSSYGYPPQVPCCGNQAKTTANKQANEAQTHN